MARKNQVGNWVRKTKPTQGASVNTPRHCSEMFFHFLRLLAARQAMDFSTTLGRAVFQAWCQILHKASRWNTRKTKTRYSCTAASKGTAFRGDLDPLHSSDASFKSRVLKMILVEQSSADNDRCKAISMSSVLKDADCMDPPPPSNEPKARPSP